MEKGERRVGVIAKHLIPQGERMKRVGTEKCSSKILELPLKEDTSVILENERKNASFDPEKLTNILDGGEETTTVKSIVAARLETDPLLKDEVICRIQNFFF